MKYIPILCGIALAVSICPARGPSPSPVRSGTATGSELAHAERRILTGWGGGKAEDVVSKAAEVGFAELVVHHEDTANFTQLIEIGKQHGIGIFAWLFLGDIPAWKKAFPQADPPLQVISPCEQEMLKKIQADKTPGKSHYQFGGEPINEMEVLECPLLCFHDPRVLVAFKKQIDEMLAFPGVKGVALDFIGYQNYRCCLCPTSQAQLAVFRDHHPELSRELALQRFRTFRAERRIYSKLREAGTYRQA